VAVEHLPLSVAAGNRRVSLARHVPQREGVATHPAGGADTNIDFEDLCALLRSLGFSERTRGSHHVFARPGVDELLNLQQDGGKAKPYQVRQVRHVVLKYNLASGS